MQSEKILSIDSFFEKDKTGAVSKNALLLQDIVNYSSVNTSFKFQELANWLAKNNKEFRDELGLDSNYSSNKHTRLGYFTAKKRDRIMMRLGELKRVHYVFIKGKVDAERFGQTDLYIFGEKALAMASFLSLKNCIDLEQKTSLLALFFSLVRDMYLPRYNGFERNISTTFMLKFLDKIFENGLYHRIIDTLLERSGNNDGLFEDDDMRRFFVRFLQAMYGSVELRKDIWPVNLEIIKNEEPAIRRVILLYEKQVLEHAIASYNDKPREWELEWAKNIDDEEKLTLLGLCIMCAFHGPVVVDYFDFRQAIANSTNGVMIQKCKRCGAKDGLGIALPRSA